MIRFPFLMIKPMTKTRVLLALMAFSSWGNARAQTLVSPAFQDTEPPADVKQHRPRVLTIHAAAEPDPALRYRFWPAAEHRSNENPMPFVSRSIMLSLKSMNDRSLRKEFSETHTRWSDMPLRELPRKEVRAFLNRFGGTALTELAHAEKLMRIEHDLQWDTLSASEMVETLLPELQEMRQLARLLQIRVRLAVAEQRWDDAIDDIRLGFRLAEIAGHNTDFLIGRLVGFAISGIMMTVTLEAIEQPGCPNLYWALASLPENRLFETRDSIEFESILISRLITQSRSLPDQPIGPNAARSRIRDFAGQASRMLPLGNGRGSDDFNAKMLMGLYVVAMTEPSRDLLATSTVWGEKARELSASEAVVRATHLNFSRARDRWVKWSLLPAEAWSEYEAERTAVFSELQAEGDVLVRLVHTLSPAVDAARRAGRRTLQQRNVLISIEAIRMHVAVQGEFPKTIDNLRPVPCWGDGISLAPFGYHRTSPTTATLTRHERWSGDPDTTFQLKLMKGNK